MGKGGEKGEVGANSALVVGGETPLFVGIS